MKSEETRTWKGFRPSRFGGEVEQEGAVERKAINMPVYADRAALGLPIFGEETIMEGGK